MCAWIHQRRLPRWGDIHLQDLIEVFCVYQKKDVSGKWKSKTMTSATLNLVSENRALRLTTSIREPWARMNTPASVWPQTPNRGPHRGVVTTPLQDKGEAIWRPSSWYLLSHRLPRNCSCYPSVWRVSPSLVPSTTSSWVIVFAHRNPLILMPKPFQLVTPPCDDTLGIPDLDSWQGCWKSATQPLPYEMSVPGPEAVTSLSPPPASPP